MDPQKEKIVKLVPAIRMIMSSPNLKSGSFVPLDQLRETDPEQITARLGRSISVFKGETDEILVQIQKAKEDIGEYIFMDNLGLLGLSSNKSKVEQKLATVRKESRGADLPESVAPPQMRKPLYNRIVAITGGAMGYGEGIARHLYTEGANVVIMDINEEAGLALTAELNSADHTQQGLVC